MDTVNPMGGTRATTAVLTTVTAALGAVLTAAPAAADTEDDVIRDLTIDIQIDADGTLHVTETYEWDFGSREGLGLRRSLAQRFAWPDDPDLMRVYEYDDVDVTSPSGAPADVWVAGDDAYLDLDIGAPDGSSETRSGVQTYELSYTVDGALNAIRGEDGVPDQDELFWNVTGDQWENTIETVTTRVRGPVDITDQECWEGASGSDQECAQSTSDGNRATFFTHEDLDPGEQQTIAVAFPAGTFDDIEPILVPAQGDVAGETLTQQRIATVTDPVADVLTRFWPVPALALLALYVLGLRRRIREGRDFHFVGLTPGTFPPAHEEDSHPVAQLEREPVETVRFIPPDGVRPAEAAAIDSLSVPNSAVAATMVDLAVRGFLRIREADVDRRGRPKDWELALASNAFERRGEMTPDERHLLGALFRDGPTVRLSALKKEQSFAKSTGEVRKEVARAVDRRRLFVRPIEPTDRTKAGMTRRGWTLLVQVILATLVAFATFGGTAGNLLPPSAQTILLSILGALVVWLFLRAVTYRTSYRRTAAGRALYDQIRGFRLYLTTAEAEQIRFEEGIDVFSRYLPYAIVFGVAERWAEIFEQLQAQGRAHVDTTWYVGSTPGAMPNISSIGSSMSSFSSAVSPTTGSSGGSGFGGGGGAGGGGGGGGGGGR